MRVSNFPLLTIKKRERVGHSVCEQVCWIQRASNCQDDAFGDVVDTQGVRGPAVDWISKALQLPSFSALNLT